MHETLASESTKTALRRLWGDTHPGARYFALFRERLSGVTADPSSDTAGRRNTETGPSVGPADSTLRADRVYGPRALIRRAGLGRLASVAPVLLALAALLVSPDQRASASDLQRPSEGLYRSVAPPAPGSYHSSVTAWVMREKAVVTERSEDDEEEDDDRPCSATRQAYEISDLSLSLSRSAPACKLAVPRRLSAAHPLRC